MSPSMSYTCSKHEFACIPIAAVHVDMSLVQEEHYMSSFCASHVFSQVLNKMDTPKL